MRSTRCSTRCRKTPCFVSRWFATPQDVLESDLNHLAKKAVGETLASEQTLKDVHEARSLIGSARKLYQGHAGVLPARARRAELDRRGSESGLNVMLNAGLAAGAGGRWWRRSTATCAGIAVLLQRQQSAPVVHATDVQLQHAANLSPVWSRAQARGHPGITMFNRGGGPITFDPPANRSGPADERPPVPVRPDGFRQIGHRSTVC